MAVATNKSETCFTTTARLRKQTLNSQLKMSCYTANHRRRADVFLGACLQLPNRAQPEQVLDWGNGEFG
jgi:hypothetical protein